MLDEACIVSSDYFWHWEVKNGRTNPDDQEVYLASFGGGVKRFFFGGGPKFHMTYP